MGQLHDQRSPSGAPLPTARALPHGLAERARELRTDAWQWTSQRAHYGCRVAAATVPVVGVLLCLALASAALGGLSSSRPASYPQFDIQVPNPQLMIPLTFPEKSVFELELPGMDQRWQPPADTQLRIDARLDLDIEVTGDSVFTTLPEEAVADPAHEPATRRRPWADPTPPLAPRLAKDAPSPTE